VIAERVSMAEEVGLSPARLQRIDALINSFIDRGVISGAVTLVARNGRIGHLVAHGQMDIAAGRPMANDTIFRLASMTKPVISVAILMLFEEGKILLTEPLSNFLPTFKSLSVAVRTAGSASDFHLVPADRELTLRDLLTHTSGLGSAVVGPGAVAMDALNERSPRHTLAEIVPRMADVPLSFQPGSAWEYSPVFAFDTLGHVVEIVSGVQLDQFLQRRVFEPLGMRDTAFSQPAEKHSRVVTVYERASSGSGLQPAPVIPLLELSMAPDNRYFCGAGGLAGTAEDYSRFALMLANGGELDGERLLSRRTVELMASNQIGQLTFPQPVTDMRGYRFGLGVKVLDNPAEAATLASRGTFGWAGAFGTYSWIDPVEQLVGVYLIQRMPDITDEVLRSIFPRFETTAYQAIED
jgi:CubicO group peptidase (beta-lactamase class C family)